MKRLFAALPLAFMLVPSAAMAETFKTPAVDTPHGTIVAGLKLLRDGKFDDWIGKYCSKDKKCFNDQANGNLKRYNLPAMQRRAKNCVKDGDSIEVTRTDKISETELKIFVQCETTAMPIPFWLIKESDGWKFSNI